MGQRYALFKNAPGIFVHAPKALLPRPGMAVFVNALCDSLSPLTGRHYELPQL